MINNVYYSYSDKELIEKWGKKLKSLRVEAGFSQTELAEKTGMSRSSIAEIEKGRNFSIASLLSISRVLEFLNEFEFFFKEEEYEIKIRWNNCRSWNVILSVG